MYDDLVVCIDKGHYPLTEGKIYKVVIVKSLEAYLETRDDNGTERTFFQRRFIPVNKLLKEDWTNE